jgi:hypothetical protein
MMIKKLLILGGLMLAPLTLAAQDPEEDKPIPIKGRWLVSHEDRLLGQVTGRATIDEDEVRARVTLQDPVSGQDYVLRSSKIERTDDQLIIELEGFWPGARDYKEQPLGAEIDVTGSLAPPEGAAIGNMALGVDVREGGPVKLDDLKVEYRGKASNLEVYKPGFPDIDTVTLTLTIGEESLYGQWSYTANSQTGRDRKGNGRVGTFAFANDNSGEATQTGGEIWTRPKPVINVVIPTHDQVHIKQYGDAAFPYPWKKNGELVTHLADRRYLLVVGTNLPQKLGEGAQFTSSDENITYHLQSKKKDFGAMGGDGGRVENALERIRKQILRRFRVASGNGTVSIEQLDKLTETMEALRKQDMVIVRAELKNGATPGLKGFTLDGTEESWVLRYGDFNADFSFSRPVVGTKTDPLDYAFAPERVHLELRSFIDMPHDQIPMQLWLTNEAGKYAPHMFEGSRNIMAVRLPVTDADRKRLANQKARAKKNGGNPDAYRQVYIWRTPPMVLVDEASAADGQTSIAPKIKGDWRVPVRHNTKIRGLIGKITTKEEGKKDKVDNARYWLNTNPSMTEIGIIGATNEVAQFTLPGSSDNNLTWPGALRAATQCAGINLEPPINWNQIAQKTAHEFTNVIVLQAEIAKLNMTVGDHAAMLMLRDVFIESQKRQLANLDAIDTYGEIEGFRESARVPVNTVDNHPLAELQAPTPDGDELSFEMTFSEDSFLNGRYGITKDNIDLWRQQATLDVIGQYRATIQKSMDMAIAAKTCLDENSADKYKILASKEKDGGTVSQQNAMKSQREENLTKLAHLTSNGFAAMQRYAIARMVNTDATAENEGAEWKTDRLARLYALGVPTFAGALSSQQAYSQTDTQIMVTSVAVATSVTGLGGGLLAAGRAASWGPSVLGWAVSEGYSAAAIIRIATILDVYSTLDSIASTGMNKYTSLAELEFARGAVASLGMQRLDNAIANDPHWASVIFSVYLDIAPELVGMDFHGLVSGPLNLLPQGRRLISTTESIAEGRRLLGVVDASSSATEAATEVAETTADLATDARKIADSFPDTSQMDEALGVNFDDFVSPTKPPEAPKEPSANTNTGTNAAPSSQAPDAADLTETAQIPRGQPDQTPPDNIPSDTAIDTPAAVGNDTVMDTPGNVGGNVGSDTVMDAPIGASAPVATQAQPNYQMRNPQDATELPAIRAEVDAAYAQAQVYAQEAFDQGRQLTRTEIINLEATAQAANTQELIEDAVSEARRAGVPEADINQTLATTQGTNAMQTRLMVVRELELAAVEELGFDVVLPEYADNVLELATRSLQGDLAPTDLARLRNLIEEAADRGEDFFKNLERQGTFDFYRDTNAGFNPGAGFEQLADPDSIAALRRVAEDNDLIPDLTATNITSQAGPAQPAVTSLDDVRGLPKPQRASVLAAMADARAIARNLGDSALDSAEAAAVRLAKEATEETAGLPGWGQRIGRDAYDRLRYMSYRSDVHKMAFANSAQLRQVANDPFSLNVLEGAAFKDMDELTAAIAKERKRIKEPFGTTFKETSPDTPDPDNVALNDRVYSGTSDDGLGQMTYSETRIMVDGQKVGVFTRTKETVTLGDGSRMKQMTMAKADAKGAPRFFEGVDNPMTKHGIPAATYMNTRAFHNLEIPFGDPTLGRVKMNMVMNANTSIQIEWMKRVYGPDNINDFLKHTHSVRYAESALNQAGFKIKRVELGPRAVRGKAGHMAYGEYFHAKEGPTAFMERYGIHPNDKIETGHHIFIYVEPL